MRPGVGEALNDFVQSPIHFAFGLGRGGNRLDRGQCRYGRAMTARHTKSESRHARRYRGTEAQAQTWHG